MVWWELLFILVKIGYYSTQRPSCELHKEPRTEGRNILLNYRMKSKTYTKVFILHFKSIFILTIFWFNALSRISLWDTFTVTARLFHYFITIYQQFYSTYILCKLGLLFFRSLSSEKAGKIRLHLVTNMHLNMQLII